MFSGSQFDGGFTFTQSSQPTDFPTFRSRDSAGVTPLTVKQISVAYQSGDEKSNFSVDGVDLTNAASAVEDVWHFNMVNENFETMEMMKINEGIYVRVNGHLNSFQGMKQVAAFSVRPVTNFDEVTFHYIDCLHTHLQNVKLQQGGGSIQSQVVEPSLNTPARNGLNEQSSSIQISKQFSVDGLKDSEQGQEKGVHMDELCQNLKLPMEKIKDLIRCLEDEDLIYSTIDEFHYKAT